MSAAQPWARTRASSRSSRARIGDRRVGVGVKPGRGEGRRDVRVVGEQHLAHGRRVGGEEGAHVERLQRVVGPEYVVHDEDLLLVERADPHRLARACRQRIGPVQRAGAKLVAVEIAGTHVQQRRAQLVLPALGVLLDKPDALQRTQQPVDGSLRRAPSRPRCPPPQVAGCAPTGAAGSSRLARWTECCRAPRPPRYNLDPVAPDAVDDLRSSDRHCRTRAKNVNLV